MVARLARMLSGGRDNLMSEVVHTEEDIKIAVKIFEQTLKYFNVPSEPTEESTKEFTREDGTIDLSKVPLVSVREWDNGAKFLNLIYFYDGVLTVCAEYSPLISILEFLGEARKLINIRYPHWAEDERETSSQFETFRMTILLFSRLYPRMNLAMQSFVGEVIQAWFIDRRKWEAQVYSESGIKPIPVSETKEFRNLLKWHEDDLLKLWLKAPDRKLDEKKMQFAKEYPAILRHWQNLRTWCRSVGIDWRIYSKPEGFSDTPDDLLDKIQDSDSEKTSFLALEHAARRAGLLKVTQDEKILERRAQQIKVTGYTPRQLQYFFDEGKKLLDEMQVPTSLHPNNGTGELES